MHHYSNRRETIMKRNNPSPTGSVTASNQGAFSFLVHCHTFPIFLYGHISKSFAIYPIFQVFGRHHALSAGGVDEPLELDGP